MKKIIVISLLALFFVSCTKEYSFEGATIKQPITHNLPLSDTTLIGDTTVFYDCEFDGQRELQIAGLNNCVVFTGGTAVPYVYNDYGQYTVDFFGNDSLSTLSFLRSNINLMPTDTSYLLKNQRMYQGFTPNTYAYTLNIAGNNGVIIQRHDAAGTPWATNLGIADQSGSTFQIIKEFNVDNAYNTTGVTHGIYLLCKFNCILYDGTGKTITIKNGRMGIVIWL